VYPEKIGQRMRGLTGGVILTEHQRWKNLASGSRVWISRWGSGEQSPGTWSMHVTGIKILHLATGSLRMTE
jgi:hypothetical protein